MPDNFQTYAFEFKGGLISNLAPLQHGIQQPGTARVLKNFEPSVEGGYKKILGYTKFDSNIVPGFNLDVLVFIFASHIFISIPLRFVCVTGTGL